MSASKELTQSFKNALSEVISSSYEMIGTLTTIKNGELRLSDNQTCERTSQRAKERIQKISELQALLENARNNQSLTFDEAKALLIYRPRTDMDIHGLEATNTNDAISLFVKEFKNDIISLAPDQDHKKLEIISATKELSVSLDKIMADLDPTGSPNYTAPEAINMSDCKEYFGYINETLLNIIEDDTNLTPERIDHLLSYQPIVYSVFGQKLDPSQDGIKKFITDFGNELDDISTELTFKNFKTFFQATDDLPSGDNSSKDIGTTTNHEENHDPETNPGWQSKNSQPSALLSDSRAVPNGITRSRSYDGGRTC